MSKERTPYYIKSLKIACVLFFSLIFFNTMAIADTENAQVKKLKDYPPYPNIEVSTNRGKFYLSLDGNRAPITTQNFLQYVDDKFYNNTIFHRVIPGFVAQGGGHDEEFRELITRDNIINESGNGLSNIKGTIAMAREFAPHTANSQFFINLVDNQKLDPRPDRWGYTVFGEVVSGLHLIQDISQGETGPGGDFEENVPVKPFIVRSMRIMGLDEEIPVEKIIFDQPKENILKETQEQAKENIEKLPL